MSTIPARRLRVRCLHREDPLPDPQHPIRGINAAGWLMSRASLQRTGGFDPLFLMYGKDDLINRAPSTASARRWCRRRASCTCANAPSRRRGAVGSPSTWDRNGCAPASSSPLKDPAMSLPYGLARLAVAGIVEPLLNLPLTREFRHAVLSCYATLRLAAELLRIARHPLIVRARARMDRI
jgi:hypothetical protein